MLPTSFLLVIENSYYSNPAGVPLDAARWAEDRGPVARNGAFGNSSGDGPLASKTEPLIIPAKEDWFFL